jgi:hypothetical protein
MAGGRGRQGLNSKVLDKKNKEEKNRDRGRFRSISTLIFPKAGLLGVMINKFCPVITFFFLTVV